MGWTGEIESKIHDLEKKVEELDKGFDDELIDLGQKVERLENIHIGSQWIKHGEHSEPNPTCGTCRKFWIKFHPCWQRDESASICEYYESDEPCEGKDC